MTRLTHIPRRALAVAFLAAAATVLAATPAAAKITGLELGPQAAPPGTVFSGTFTADAPSQVSGEVYGPTGAVVRTLFAGRQAVTGSNDISWDGRDANGAVQPEGHYRVNVTSEGHSAGPEPDFTITIDGSDPLVSLLPRSRIGRRQKARASASDALTGIAWIALEVNGRMVRRADDLGEVRFRPSGGWRCVRRYKLRATAVDEAGNSTTAKRTVRGGC